MLKELVIELATKSIRTFLTGTSTRFRLKKPQFVKFPQIIQGGLYIHVPFCEQLCGYCPYNRIPYNTDLAKGYIKAIIREIEYYSQQLPKIEVTSIYFGGGTPTVLSKGIEKIIDALCSNFYIVGPLCIETNPGDLTSEKVNMLKSLEVQAISLGIQSFYQKWLDLIGRQYTFEKVETALAWLEKADFAAVNIDLMFALPGQNLKELEADLRKATSTFVDQITCYPLFTFPYSSVGQYRKLKNVEMPKLSSRKKMYYFLYNYLTDRGYRRVSVWSFKKRAETPRFSSVTRECYVGFGPGAGSYYKSLFTLNTFCVEEYINSIKEKGHAVALEMPITPMLSINYDLYWRLYDTYVPEVRKLDRLTYRLRDIKRLHLLVKLGELSGMLKKNDDIFELSQKGAFWIHLIQNYFSLRYINKIWTVAKREAWPESITF